MASRKVYFSDEEYESELQIFMNTDDKLFVSLDDPNSIETGKWITLPKEDAVEIILYLAESFGLLNETKNAL